jgi:hypothetical protein
MDMQKNTKQIIIIFILLFSGCSGYRSTLYQGQKGLEYARMNVIKDFVNTYKTPKEYIKRYAHPFNVFFIKVRKHLNNSIYVITVRPQLPGLSHYSLQITDSLGKIPTRGNFPNRYVVEKGKLFLWKDSISPLKQELLNIMDKYQVLDSVDVKRELGLLPDDFVDDRMVVIDDRLEGVSYLICKNDISKYKKKYHWKAFGYFKPPKIRCRK